jgi:wyosine [tRNA(Phe)-imidazoG37] synthetase (radical SAM superfamily)
MIFGEIRSWLENYPLESSRLDYITFSGLGEPTLHSGLGELIRLTKDFTDIPLAVITNASRLSHREVREQILPVELIVPSLDAVEESVFSQIDRPHGDISVSEIINGLIQLRKEYKGKIWLEIMLIKGVNDSSAHINTFKEVIGKINADKVQLNSPVRTTAESGIRALEEEKLKEIQKSIGLNCEII